jgi:dTDP-4-amino-4,6-dideoxygalactose transaminase
MTIKSGGDARRATYRYRVFPPLSVKTYFRRPSRHLPFPLAEHRCRIFAWARHALWHGLRAVGVGEGDAVLAPAYHHGSEIEALARAGVGCLFYEATDSLEPDAAELEALLSPQVRALYLIHYLGFPQDARRWRRWCDDRGLLLIEDAAQAWLASQNGSPLGSLGDVAIFCLYKTFGLPEGAALVCAALPRSPGQDRRIGFGVLLRRNGAWLAQRSAVFARLGAILRQPRAYNVEEDFDLRDPESAPWRSVSFLLPRLAYQGAAARRRANYETLLELFRERVPSPFATLRQGTSPFGFPLKSADKERLLSRLAERGVKALDVWSIPHPSLEVERFPLAGVRRATTVALPVHQELSTRDLNRLADSTAYALADDDV